MPLAAPPRSATTEPMFRFERLGVIGAMERDHFWHAPRRRLLLDTISRWAPPGAGPLVDVGCGTGAMVSALLARGYDAYGVDPFAAKLGLAEPRFTTGSVENVPWPTGRVTTACAFDVLEHVDDLAAARELARILAPDGRLLVSVPAFSFLWGPRDEVAGHRQRYTPATLRRLLSEAGFVVERLFGFQALLLPLLAAQRLAARFGGRQKSVEAEDRPPLLLNAALRAVNEIEVTLGRLARPPVGSSLVAVASKPRARVDRP